MISFLKGLQTGGTGAGSKFFDYNSDGIQDLIVDPMTGIQLDH